MTRYIDLPWEQRLTILREISALAGRVVKGSVARGLIVWCHGMPHNTSAMIESMLAHGLIPEGQMDIEENGVLIKFVPADPDGNLYDRPHIPGKGRAVPAFRGDEPQPDQNAREKR